MALNLETLKSTRRTRPSVWLTLLRELGISVLLVAAGVQLWLFYGAL